MEASIELFKKIEMLSIVHEMKQLESASVNRKLEYAVWRL